MSGSKAGGATRYLVVSYVQRELRTAGLGACGTRGKGKVSAPKVRNSAISVATAVLERNKNID